MWRSAWFCPRRFLFCLHNHQYFKVQTASAHNVALQQYADDTYLLHSPRHALYALAQLEHCIADLNSWYVLTACV